MKYAWIGLVLVAGCTVNVTTPTGTKGSPAPKGSPAAAKVELAAQGSDWVGADALPEPPAGPVQLACNSPAPGGSYEIKLAGGQLSIAYGGGGAKLGGACPAGQYFASTSAKAEGAFANNQASLKGQVTTSYYAPCAGGASPPPPVAPTDTSFELKYDPATQHLTGTHDGKPFWAAPAKAPASACPTLPPAP